MKQILLVGERVVLEPLRHHHIDSYVRMFSARVQELLRVKTIASERAYLEQKLSQKSDALFFYIIKERKNNALIGAIEIRDPSHRSQLYCWLHEQWWGTGYFQEALMLVAENYFNTMKESTLSACVDYENKRSYYALKKAGFRMHEADNRSIGKQYTLTLSGIKSCV